MKQSHISQTIYRSSKRFMQTVQAKQANSSLPPQMFKSLEQSSASNKAPSSGMATASSTSPSDEAQSKKWATYSLPRKAAKPLSFTPAFNPTTTSSIPFKLNKAAKPFSFNKPSSSSPLSATKIPSEPLATLETKPLPISTPPANNTSASTTPTPTPTSTETAAPTKKPRRKLRARKAAITISPAAVDHLRALLDQPNPQMIRIGVRNRGCSGLTYHLEYVDQPQKFDEEIVQDGVKVLIDSKALFSIIGSEMDWVDDKLSTRFVFHNPNVKGECGCGESFMV